MANTVLAVYNLALAASHAKGRMSSLSENSREREECDEWYDTVIGVVQEAAHWEGCRTTARLALLATRDFAVSWADGDPEAEFKYSYALPTNYLRARHLTGYERFSISYDPTRSRRVISTDVELAVLVFNRRQEDVAQWSEGQKMATVYGLAAHICGALSGDYKLIEKNFGMANANLMNAQESISNSDSYEMAATASWIEARGATNLAPQTQYIYPVGQIFANAVANV